MVKSYNKCTEVNICTTFRVPQQKTFEHLVYIDTYYTYI